ncbi:major facilitator superfamily MFS_1 [Afipia carboxidovorans OM5]|uniref:Oxalate:formate antiporter OxlT n=1 Tax=Afipia carboxidovorans (strain ATCC 49405 / DSM 1227 / KCTC 32145 / OM5) TaxID=504832 RepID=B6JF06_AFIC5|nr:oxalate/formate MFS antiporter [Afipia carboxidovorans]ACI94077.1 major facilitator superfamily MFS_1 [Afipia carboxidovorans OM5]AEI02263.1 oxalate:formate antiporter OxlT [Afipia carboxidovorans OM4]AEI05839.1 oxalate:formate antiporter OxlT [Afipia carboxidovorans OM5]
MTTTTAPNGASPSTRWFQLILGMIAMMAISSPQYVWALFTGPLTEKLRVPLAEIQVTFSLLIVLQTFLSPAQGYLVDRFGPRLLLSFGAALTGLSWVLAAQVESLMGLYLTYGLLGGIGTGIIYVGVVGMMVQWFPDKRGLATGLVAAGYGFGAILTTLPISTSLKTSGLSSTLMTFGVIIGVVGILAALGTRRPSTAVAHVAADAEERGLVQETRNYTPREMLRSPIFYLLFVMMTMMSTSGLMVISQMGAFAKDFGVKDALVFGLAALPLALTIDRITNGLTRPFFGWVSDRIGRENTMTIAFGLEGIAMTIWLLYAHNPLAFVLLSGVVFFGWGEIFSLFPSTLTDTFGTKHATTNYGFLYIAQGIGAILGGPLAALLHQMTLSWHVVFGVAITMDLATAFLAFFVLKRMRANHRARNAQQMAALATA